MKRFAAIIAFCATSFCLHAQVVNTTVCDVLKDPASFNGKTVQLKGLVTAGFDQFEITDKSCGFQVNAIWLDYPEGTHGKAGPVALLQTATTRAVVFSAMTTMTAFGSLALSMRASAR